MSQVWAVSRTSVGPPLTIIGKDLDAGATLNADVAEETGPLRAGTFMSFAAGVLTKSTGSNIFGILADEFTDVGAPGPVPAMVYRRGVFLRQEIESANNVSVVQDSAIDKALRALGIYLEQSYETYVGLQPVPSGVEPLSIVHGKKSWPVEEHKAPQGELPNPFAKGAKVKDIAPKVEVKKAQPSPHPPAQPKK